MVNATKVLLYDTSLSGEVKFALNDTAHFSRYHSVDITNSGSQPVTYAFTLQPAGGFNAEGYWHEYLTYDEEILPVSIVPSVSFPQGSFVVQPGQTRKAQINFNAPAGYDASGMYFYGGKVLISGSNGDELSVPYVGGAFDLKKKMRGNMFSGITPYQWSGPDLQDIGDYHTYNFDLTPGISSYPTIYCEFKWGIKELRFDIFEPTWKEKDWVYPPVPGKNGYIGAATYFLDSDRNWNRYPGVMDKNRTIPFPLTRLIRTSISYEYEQAFFWFGKLANGSYIAPGDYRYVPLATNLSYCLLSVHLGHSSCSAHANRAVIAFDLRPKSRSATPTTRTTGRSGRHRLSPFFRIHRKSIDINSILITRIS